MGEFNAQDCVHTAWSDQEDSEIAHRALEDLVNTQDLVNTAWANLEDSEDAYRALDDS